MNSTIKTLMLAGLTVAVLAACGKQEATTPVAAPDAAPAPAAAPAAAAAPSVSSGPVQANYALPADAIAGGNCALDTVNAGPPTSGSVAAGSDAVLVGWIGNANNQVPTDALIVLKGAAGSYSAPLAAGGDRPDVAAALATEGLRTSGFNVSTTLAGVAPGSYELEAVYPGSPTTFCAFKASLTVN